MMVVNSRPFYPPTALWEITQKDLEIALLKAKLAEAEGKLLGIQERLNKPVHPYGDTRIPEMPESKFLRDAYGDELVDDIEAFLPKPLEKNPEDLYFETLSKLDPSEKMAKIIKQAREFLIKQRLEEGKAHDEW